MPRSAQAVRDQIPQWVHLLEREQRHELGLALHAVDLDVSHPDAVAVRGALERVPLAHVVLIVVIAEPLCQHLLERQWGSIVISHHHGIRSLETGLALEG